MGKVLGWVVYVLVYVFTWILSVLPQRLFYALSDVSAFLLCYVVRYRRGTVLGNLRRSFPEKSEAEVRRIAWGFYRHLSDLILEEAFLLHASAKRMMARCSYTNVELLTPYYEAGRSVVIAAAHYANWEFLTTAAPQIRHKMLSIYKPVNNKRLERLLTGSRERLGSETVLMKDTFRTVLRYEQQHVPTLIGLITDQTPWKGNHYWGRFLNQDTLVFRGIEHIAKRFNLPVFFCNMQRVRRGHYQITLELITDDPCHTPDDWITAQHLAALERCIQANPAPWLWSHRRWKYSKPTMPDGQG